MLRPTALRPLFSQAARRGPLLRPTFASSTSAFHTTARRLVNPGDQLPDTDALMENTPGTRVNLAEEAKKVNNMLVIGVPAAFSPGCSTRHIPGYIAHPRLGEFESVAVVSVNDVFV